MSCIFIKSTISLYHNTNRYPNMMKSKAKVTGKPIELVPNSNGILVAQYAVNKTDKLLSAIEKLTEYTSKAMQKVTVRIYGATPEIFQDVIAEYEYIYTGAKHVVNYCRILFPLMIIPTDLTEDLRVAIAEDLGCLPYQVSIDTFEQPCFL